VLSCYKKKRCQYYDVLTVDVIQDDTFHTSGGKKVQTHVKIGDRGSTVVKVLCYKSEGHWFDPRW